MAPNARDIRAIVFDLDDTLYRELDYVRSGFRAVAAHINACTGVEPADLFRRLWCAFQSGPRDRVFNTVLTQLRRDDSEDTIRELVAVYRNHRPDLTLAPDVATLLDRLHQRHQLGIITDGFLPAQRYKVEALKLAGNFDHIIYTEELGREYWKPSPLAYEEMARKLGADHAQCLYVADNPAKDFVAPNQLGWRSIQLKRANAVHADKPIAPGGAPQRCIACLAELETVLGE